ncbi:MAG: hypothetical protein H8E32_07025 [Nitrospinae bacterium]|nr:hypothetical protein [Nitrospinota bacterium]
MKCPNCRFEQPTSDACAHCGIIFSKYKKAQERKKEVSKDIRPSSTPSPQYNSDDDLKLIVIGALFLSILFTRSIYFMEFPVFLDPYFRLLMMGVLCWLTFGIVPRTAALFTRLEEEGETKRGLEGFNIYDKKAIFIFMTLAAVMFALIAWALLTGSVECFSGRNRTCHEIYNSVADPGEFWVTILVMYLVSLFPITVGIMGIQERRNRQL